jgi:hypothetical protein
MTGSHERIACRDPISRDGDDDRFSFHPGVGLIAAGAVVFAVNSEAVNRELFTYTEGYYNRRSVDSALGHIMPEQAERKAA